jgi:hypothetical protein
MTTRQFGVLDLTECAGMTGKELLQAIVDGRLPQPPISKTFSFWITEVGDGHCCRRAHALRRSRQR